MKILDISYEEALQVIEDDKKIDKGEKLFELTDEQKKASKSARQADRKPTVYKFDTSKKKKVESLEKKSIIAAIVEKLTESGAVDFEVTNEEREFTFSVNETKYKIVLSCPRKQGIIPAFLCIFTKNIFGILHKK